jgi:hypothetical protein
MTELDPVERAVRQAVVDLAGEGRPVDLGEAALRSMRRRRVRMVAASTVAVAALIAAVAVWPGWADRTAVPPADPTPAISDAPWPPFRGLGLVPSPPWGEAADPPPEAARRMVIAAYQTPERHLYVLDPTTHRYRRAPAANLEAVSPDLRYALISRGRIIVDAGEALTIGEFGVYDTVLGRVLGRVDIPRAARDEELYPTGIAWSPDGTTVVVTQRAGLPNGGGWLVRKMAIVDARTGQVSSVAVEPAGGLEPLAMVGWASDSQRLIFQADPVNTDMIATGYLLVDRRTGDSTAVNLPAQGDLVLGVASKEMALHTAETSGVVVLNQLTGQVLHEYPPPLAQAPYHPFLAWRGGELVVMEDCDRPPSCGIRRVFAIDPETGSRRTLASTPDSAQWLWVAPANGAVPMGSSW